MKKSIYVNEINKFIIACDGEKVEIIGSSPLANQIRDIASNPNSLYSSALKSSGSDFDPIEFWVQSSQNFADGDVMEFSEQNLASAKESIK